ncbi:hypothetical protein H8S25_13625 [Roseburia sp. NSJ-67]|uniref:Uncharacterized protein n=1 Tax=Roseburia difficilis TaxID=2763060 RepID=A0ABR7GYF4_9FIRM|nr:hypothetical protein [Roseburia difficilis]
MTKSGESGQTEQMRRRGVLALRSKADVTAEHSRSEGTKKRASGSE